ncbi:MAG TPA: hypothetical protein VGC21_13320, partial [Telluria sp.]
FGHIVSTKASMLFVAAAGYTRRLLRRTGQSSSGQCNPALKLNQKPKMLNNFSCRSKCDASRLLGGYAFRIEIKASGVVVVCAAPVMEIISCWQFICPFYTN